ncbi:hypothetical protein [Flavobacterium psychrophilum]|uniref:hypothetical protein n=1 Tax=Flavobacterium psychrophilum TaxID=96345 RepID=UPI001D090D51|nr:hypothetical protein [Flavobacterium psychrophilum]MCB6097685.1 hypothetical protein [Flavobacterium psychrophilum]
MYSINETRLIFARCKDYIELEKICDAFLLIIYDNNFSQKKLDYIKLQAKIRFRQLKALNFILEKSMQRFKELENL